jgi:hypothetical protein
MRGTNQHPSCCVFTFEDLLEAALGLMCSDLCLLYVTLCTRVALSYVDVCGVQVSPRSMSLDSRATEELEVIMQVGCTYHNLTQAYASTNASQLSAPWPPHSPHTPLPQTRTDPKAPKRRQHVRKPPRNAVRGKAGRVALAALGTGEEVDVSWLICG